MPPDKMLYDIMGYKRDRASPVDLVGPRGSRIVQCMSSLRELRVSFDCNSPDWILTPSLRVLFDTYDVRLMAMRSLVQHRIGIVGIETNCVWDIHRITS